MGCTTSAAVPRPQRKWVTAGLLSLLLAASAPCAQAETENYHQSIVTGSLPRMAAGDEDYAAAGDVAFSVEVFDGLSDQVIVVTPPPGPLFSGEPAVMGFTTNAPHIPVIIATGTPDYCRTSGTSIYPLQPGTCVVTVNASGDSSFKPAVEQVISLHIEKERIPQWVNFSHFGSVPIGSSLSITYTGNSGMPVVFASTTPGVCTVTGNVVSGLAVGTCRGTVNADGNSTYLPAWPQAFSLEVVERVKSSQLISLTPPQSARIGTDVSIQYSNSSGLPVAFASTTTGICTVTENIVTPLSVGTCIVTANAAGNESFFDATEQVVQFPVGVQLIRQVITISPLADLEVGQSATILATTDSGRPVALNSMTPRRCSVDGNVVTARVVGMCMIKAVAMGDSDYAESDTTAQFMMAAARADQVITIAPVADLPYGQSTSISAVSDSGLPVVLNTDTSAICILAGEVVTAVGIGSCSVTASAAGDETYRPATDVTLTFQVHKLSQLITVVQPADISVSQTASLQATSDTGLPVTLLSNTPAICSVVGNVATGLNAGTCSITASSAGDVNHEAAADAVMNFQVKKLEQFINASQPADIEVAQIAPLSGTSSVGLPVTFTSGTPSVCSITGSVATGINAGICSITVSAAGDANHEAATDVTVSFQVNQRGHVINVIQPSDILVGQTSSLSAISDAGLTVTLSSNTPAVCSVAGTVATGNNAGTCTITASASGDVNHTPAADVTMTFLVQRLPQIITSGLLSDIDVGQTAVLQVTSDAGLPVVLVSSTPGVCSVSGNVATGVAAGTCSVIASAAGDTNHDPAVDVTLSFQVNQLGHVITVLQPADIRIGQTEVLSATSSAGLPVGLASNTPAVCSVTGHMATGLTAGTCSVTASAAGDAGHAAAADVTVSFQVQRLSQTITITPPADIEVDEVATLQATSSAGLPVSFVSSTPGVCSVVGNLATGLAAGSCTVTASTAGDASHDPAADQAISFAVIAKTPPAKLPHTITFGQPANILIGQTAILSATSDAGLPVNLLANSPSVCSLAGNVITGISAGTCSVTASAIGDATHDAATDVTLTFLVLRLPQTITITPPVDIEVGQTATLQATTDAGLPVTFESGNPGVCSVAGNVVTGGAVGTCAVIARAAGDAVHDPAPDQIVTFLVNAKTPPAKLPQVITVVQPAAIEVDQTVTLQATSDAGLPVTFVSSTPGICSVAGQVATGVAAGGCSVTASAAGDATHNAAADQVIAFQVNAKTPPAKLPQAITVVQPAAIEVGETVTLQATSDAGLPVVLVSSTPGICSVAGNVATGVAVGGCAVTVSAAGDATHDAATDQVIAFQVNAKTPPAKLPQVITVVQPAAIEVGDTVTLSAVSDAGLPVTLLSTTPGICSVVGNAATGVATGGCSVIASAAGDATHNAATDQVIAFQVNAKTPPAKLPQVITVVQPAAIEVGQTISLQATSDAGLPVVFVSSTPGICSVAGNVATGVAAGSCSVTASAAGDATHNAAADQVIAFQVNAKTPPAKLPQVITVVQPGDIEAGKTVTLQATSDAGMPVIVSSSTPAICTVASNVVTGVAAGTCALEVTAAANDTYAAAAPVAVELVVKEATPEVVVPPQTGAVEESGSTVIDISTGVQGGPFTEAELLAVIPAAGGHASVVGGDGNFGIDFRPTPGFKGEVTIEFTLTNDAGKTGIGSVVLQVVARDNPAMDSSVVELISMQAEAARRLGQGQLRNYQQRTESLRIGRHRSAFENGITLSSASSRQQKDERMDNPTDDQLHRDREEAEEIYRAQASDASGDNANASRKFGTWASGAMNFGKTQASRYDSNIDFTTTGLTFGVDTMLGKKAFAGVGLGYGRDVTDIGEAGSRSEGVGYSVAAYGTYMPFKNVFIDAVVGMQDLDFDVRRAVGTGENIAAGKRNGDQVFGRVATGYNLRNESLVFTPYLSYEFARTDLSGFEEAGAPASSVLAYDRSSADFATVGAGVTLEWDVTTALGVFSPKLRLEHGRDVFGANNGRVRFVDEVDGEYNTFALRSFSRRFTSASLGSSYDIRNGWYVTAEFLLRRDESAYGHMLDRSVKIGIEKRIGN